MMYLPVLALIIFLAANPARSQSITAESLAKMCQAKGQAVACTSFIVGYIEGRNQSLSRPTICLARGTSVADVAIGFIQHVAKNRLDARIEAGLVLGTYLLSTHPCSPPRLQAPKR
jgi:Rap1a immunity proteins